MENGYYVIKIGPDGHWQPARYDVGRTGRDLVPVWWACDEEEIVFHGENIIVGPRLWMPMDPPRSMPIAVIDADSAADSDSAPPVAITGNNELCGGCGQDFLTEGHAEGCANETTLLQYVREYLQEEVDRGGVDQNDVATVRQLIDDAFDAYEGGAR